MTKKKYSFTDHPEHKEQLPIWGDKWIKNAMSTKAMDESDRAAMRIAIRGIYEAANLPSPPDERIVFVPSPFVARFAGGFAAAIWWISKNPTKTIDRAATRDATWDATRDATWAATRDATEDATWDATRDATWAATRDATEAATWDATRDATWAATRDATWDATRDATWAATEDATWDATRDATEDATWDATEDATWDATRDATRDATEDATWDATRDATWAATWDAGKNKNWYSPILGFLSVNIKLKLGNFGLQCAFNASNMYQGGNQWSAYDSLISFFRHVAKLDIDYSKFEHWESASLHGSYRIMHPEFCIVSDRPEVLKVDEQNRPHCEDGPFCKWRDGMGLFAWHGVRIPEWWMTHRNELTPEVALKWENLEQRRVACKIVGWANILKALDAKIIHQDSDPTIGELVEVSLPDAGKERFLRVHCGTGREFALAVPPTMKTAAEANLWTYGLDAGEMLPELRT